jgi:hypothetical protein
MQALAAVQQTAFKLPTPFRVVGVVRIFHAVPFHRSTRAVSIADAPTAKQVSEDGQDTACRAPPPPGLGVGWIDQPDAAIAGAAPPPTATSAIAPTVGITSRHWHPAKSRAIYILYLQTVAKRFGE